MNKIFKKSLLFLFAIITLASCKDTTNEDMTYKGPWYISFGATNTASAVESASTPVKVTAYASVNNLQTTETVDFTITTSDNATAASYVVVGGQTSFTFGPDKYSDTIELMPVNNFDEDGDKQVNITLTNSSGGYILGYPGVDALSKTFVFTINDDDCAFTLDGISGGWTGSDNVPSSQAGPNASQISTTNDGTNLLIHGLGYGWLTDTAYWDEVVINDVSVVASIDMITGEITIAEQFLCTTTWLGNVQPDYSIRGTGSYVSCSETMTISYDLIQNGSVLRSFTETVTKN